MGRGGYNIHKEHEHQSKNNQVEKPTTPWLSRKWKGKAKTIVNLGNIHANDNT